MNDKVTVIAEIGSNFTPGDLDSAVAMVRVAAEAGADWVKFQDFRVDNMNRPQWWRDKCRAWDMSREWLSVLADEARSLGLDLLCSVWDLESVETARWLGYPALKIAASEIGNQPLLRFVNRIRHPFFEEDGTLIDISNVLLSIDYRRHAALLPALTWLPDCAVTLLHCVSEYPADAANLGKHWPAFFDLLEYGLPVGLSSHFQYPDVLVVADNCVRKGAVVVEAHLRTVETPHECPDNGPWALFPHEFREMVDAVREAERSRKSDE